MLVSGEAEVDKILTDIGHLRLHACGAKHGHKKKTCGDKSHDNVQTFLNKETMHPCGCIALCCFYFLK
jgi:hypothetical protein